MFITFFMARSGSKYLKSLLNQHPDIHDFGECFHDRDKNFKEVSLLDQFSKIALSPEPVSGFQFRYPRHVREFPEIFKVIEESSTLKVILLKRRNKLKGAISQQNSEKLKSQTGKAHLFKNSSGAIGRLNLDIGRVIKETLQREELDEYYKEWISARLKFIEVYYEDLCQDPESELNKICSFLGCRPFKPGTLKESDLVKVTSDNISDAISNYADLVQELKVFDKLCWLDAVNHSNDVLGQVKNKSIAVLGRVSEKGRIIRFNGLMKSNKSISIDVEALPVKTNLKFLEFSRFGEIVASQGENIRVSLDAGLTWKEFNIEFTPEKCFTGVDGTRHVQAKSGTVYRFNQSWQYCGLFETGLYPWHGTWSIDQCEQSKTIIWCEYPYASEAVNVWRSTNDGVTWMPCFTQKGHAENPKLGVIRHFHLVQKCTAISGRWYLSSGDTAEQSKFWVSNDDGLSWELISIHHVSGFASDIPEALLGRLHRFTSLVQTKDKLFWVTDDTFKGRGARMCIVDKKNLNDIFVAEGNCGDNEVRNLIGIDDRYALAVSESKLNMEYVCLSLIDCMEEKIDWVGSLPNERGVKANFMNGVSSRSAVNGVFYARSDNKVIHPAPMTLKFFLKVGRE